VQHLVVDEADRMIQQGSFPELSRIFDAIHLANPMDDDSDEEDDENSLDGDEIQEAGRLRGLPGLRGEAKVEMLSADILESIERQRQDGSQPEPIEESDEEEEEGEKSLQDDESQSVDEEVGDDTPLVFRRTYVYSATLTLPATSSSFKKKHRKLDVDGAIAEILEKSRARGQTKIVDLTSSGGSKIFSTVQSASAGEATSKKPKTGASAKEAAFRLPPGLSLHQIKCTQKHKDSHLYAYLMTTEQGARGPCLVFCNSIAAVRRVGATLATLGLDVRILHAQMQQVCSAVSFCVCAVSASLDGKNYEPELVNYYKTFSMWACEQSLSDAYQHVFLFKSSRIHHSHVLFFL
jgi:ATP-dependent RNA helicase DDX24/MAK5